MLISKPFYPQENSEISGIANVEELENVFCVTYSLHDTIETYVAIVEKELTTKDIELLNTLENERTLDFKTDNYGRRYHGEIEASGFNSISVIEAYDKLFSQISSLYKAIEYYKYTYYNLVINKSLTDNLKQKFSNVFDILNDDLNLVEGLLSLNAEQITPILNHRVPDSGYTGCNPEVLFDGRQMNANVSENMKKSLAKEKVNYVLAQGSTKINGVDKYGENLMSDFIEATYGPIIAKVYNKNVAYQNEQIESAKTR